MENSEQMIRVHLNITGKVQGVFFRTHAEEKANELGVTGFVANDADSSVTVVAEGPENKINDLVDWCYGGPSTCQVDKVKVEKIPYMEEFDDFSIRY